MSSQPRPPTSVLLILLTLLAGIGLGWLLRDTLRDRADQVSAPTSVRPTTNDQRPTPSELPTAYIALPAAPTLHGGPAVPTPPAGTPQPTSMPPTPTSARTLPTPPTPTPPIVAYAGHIVTPGETLATIAANGGSTPDLIAQYNLIDGEAQPGRALIVPRLAGQAATLESAPILVQRGRADKPWIALTLDAGASAEPVPRLLTTLRERNVHITFFLTGKWIEENPDLARQIVADGHEIANHTFTHPDLTKLDDPSIRQELAGTEALLRETTGATTRPLFRPPFGAYNERVLRIVEGEGYLPVYWTLDSLDSVGEPKSPEFLFDRITGKLTPEQLRGAIILAHCGSAPTADALPQILDRFAEMGFEVKKVSEVLGE